MTNAIPYTADEKAMLNRAIDLLEADFATLKGRINSAMTPADVEAVRRALDEIGAVPRLYKQRVSAGVVAEQVAVARTTIADALGDEDSHR